MHSFDGDASKTWKYPEQLLRSASSRAVRYLTGLRSRMACVGKDDLDRLAEFDSDLPPFGEPAEQVLAMLDRIGSPATTASAGPRFFGGVIGGAHPISVAAQWLAAAWDQNACLFEFSPVGCYLEEVVIKWLGDLLGLPACCGGALVTGTQMADLSALAAARMDVLSKAGWDIEVEGIAGAPPVQVIAGEEVHATMLKALRILGFGRRELHLVPADQQGRLIPAKLPRLRGPVIVCAQLGNVNTGACDPIGEICQAAAEMGAWVHVDGAFGLWAASSPATKHLVAGAEAADSWATDMHKWLNVPYDNGIVFVRRPETLLRTMAASGAYYPSSDKRQPMFWGPESSRRTRGVEVWATLKHLGRDGVAKLVERSCRHARTFAESLRAAGCEVLNEVVLNQVLVSFGSDERTAAAIRAIQRNGTCWCGETVWRGRTAMRISVSSWATTELDVQMSIDAILSVTASL
jgi:glutamate/tyrosine decarboxylase-like PLP-dependent enzyme